ncbi:MAG TPA: hypothetical protein VGE98_17105 [Thermoanaerobaculia bacterium]
MRRLLALWLTLLAAFWLTRTALSALLFGRAPTHFESLLLLVAVPFAQAVALAWATRQPGPPLALPLVHGFRLPALRALFALDLLALGAAALALAGRLPADLCATILAACTAAKLAATAVLLALLARIGGRRRGDRLLLVAAAALCALFAALPFAASRLAALPLPERLSAGPPLLRQVAAQAALAAVAFTLVFETQSLFRRASAAATRALDWALGLALTAALVALLGAARGPAPALPWGLTARLLETLAATALLAGAVLFRWALARSEANAREVAGEEGAEGGDG